MKTMIIGFLLLTVLAAGAEASRRHHRYGTYYGFGGLDEDQEDYLRQARPRNPLFPNGIVRPVFDTPYPVVGCITRARAYIYDKSYDRKAQYCRGWKNGKFGISLNGVNK